MRIQIVRIAMLEWIRLVLDWKTSTASERGGKKIAGFAIDPAGELVSGEEFKGPRELENILLNRKKNEFVRCVSEKMLTYALGRGMEFYDQCAVDQISKALAKNKYRFSTLIMEVVKSTPFQKRRGEETPQTLSDARE